MCLRWGDKVTWNHTCALIKKNKKNKFNVINTANIEKSKPDVLTDKKRVVRLCQVHPEIEKQIHLNFEQY
jgi:hypothetical protein